MADTQVGAKLTLDANEGLTSLKSFKQQLKEAQHDVVALSEKFGSTSKEAAAAAKRAAELKDAIGDAKSLTDAFNPDTKFRAFGASINTVVGGFTALQGVMGLVGVKSEETEKALLKVQSALAISQGISQLQEGVQTFKNLGSVIQSTTLFQKANAVATNLAAGAMRFFGIQTTATSTSMNVLKGAIIATGIGALVVLLGVAADAMGLFSSSTDDAADAQARLKSQLEQVNAQLEGQTSALANEEKLDVARAKRRGASEEEIFNIQQRYRRLNFSATKKAYDEIASVDKEQGDKLLKQLNDINTAGQVAQLDFETKEIERRKQAAEKAAQAAKEARQKLLKEAEKESERRGDITLNRIDQIQIEIPKSVEQQQIENDVKAAHDGFEKKKEIWTEESNIRSKLYTDEKDQIKELEADEQASYEKRKSRLESMGTLFSALGSIIGKETAAGKVLGIAQATINTFIGATEVLRAKSVLPEPFGTISKIANVAAVIATGFAAVKNIIKTPVPGAGSGPSPSLSVSAPLQPAAAVQQSTALDQKSLNALNNATTRAFVVESDVTNNQERIRQLTRAARLSGG